MSATQEQTSMVQKAIEDWKSRYEDLQPSVQEANELRDALKAHGVEVEAEAPKAQRTTRPNGRRRGGRRRNGNGGRAGEFVTLVKDNPGISVSEAAKRLNIEANYLYRVAKKLTDEGAVRKDGTGYVPVTS